MQIDIKDLKPGYEWASNEVYFDIMQDGVPVAHVRRPMVMGRDRRWYVCAYDAQFNKRAECMTYTPTVQVRRYVLGSTHAYAN